jgi:dynein heavy chain
LVSAGAVNYLGAMTQDYRTNLLNDWISYFKDKFNMNVGDNFDLSKSVLKQHVLRKWISEKLPDDQYSIENAIFLKNSLKWPLIIDPQNQVISWIREMEGVSLKQVKSEDPLLLRTLEQAIRLGQAVLIENVGESLDPLLDSILYKHILIRGAQKIIKLGDVEVEYNDSFRLYLVTSLANPHYLPSTFIKVNVINFTITFKCLFEQFLSLVVLKERPELEKERTNLMDSISKDFAMLRELEDKSLNLLSQSETSVQANDSSSLNANSILDDQNLIDVLKQSKKTSNDIAIRLKRNEETEKKLNLARQKYSAIAVRASILYFSIQNLSSLNVMYQFSLSWFYNVFQSCLGGVSNNNEEEIVKDDYEKTESPSSALFGNLNVNEKASSKSLNSSMRTDSQLNLAGSDKKTMNDVQFKEYIDSVLFLLTHTVFKVVSWSLFAEHQLIFSFSVCINILRHKENTTSQKVTKKEYNFFLNSTLLVDLQHESLSQKIKLNYPNLDFLNDISINEKTFRQILLLQDLLPEKFKMLGHNLKQYQDTLWIRFMNSQDPYEFMSKQENYIYFNFSDLTKFQKLMLIKLIRSDALILSISHFISDTLGSKFLNTGVPTLNELYNQSLASTPIIFILSPGSDPTNQLIRFAKELRGSSLHLDIVSLGQGQGPRAEELIAKSLMLKGKWIFLQNCHLAASFMPRLQQIVNK